MSRSYREPWYVDGYGSRNRKRIAKNYANRRIRRKREEIPDGKAYRKFTDTWDICDFRHQYDPNPYVYSFFGKLVESEPEPLWKARRK